MLERGWLLGVARREREALGRAIQYTDPEAWENASPWGGRPAADVLCHLAADEIAGAAAYGGEPATEMDEWRKATPEDEQTSESWVAWSTARRLEQHPVKTALEWGRAADLFLSRASTTTDEEWHQREVPWLGGELRAGYFVQFRVAQWWVHGQDVREASGQELRREHDPTFAVNDFAVRLIPYALSLAEEAFPGKVVQVRLDQVGGGSWLQSTDPGATPEPDTDPEIYIQGRGPWFALLVTGRVDADQVLYEGTVNVGGNAEAGEAVLRSLRAFP